MIKTAAPPGQPGDPYKVNQECVGVGKADLTIAWAPAVGADHYEVWHTWAQFLGTTTKTQFTIRNVDAPSSIISPPSYYEVHVVAVNRDGRTASNIVKIPVTACWKADPCAGKTGIARWWCERSTAEKAAIIAGGAVVLGVTIWYFAAKGIAEAAAPKVTVVTGGEER